MNKFIFLLVSIFSITIVGCGGGGSGSNNNGSSSNNTLAWTAPTTNADSSTLTDLTGYKIYFGLTPGIYSGSTDIGCPASCTVENACVAGAACTYAISNLSLGSGDWCFVVTAYDLAGNESVYSNEDCTN